MSAEGFKGLIGRKMTKPVKFLGEEIKIAKLSVAQVLEIQNEATVEGKDQGLALLRKVVRMSVEGADALSDDDFDSFAMDDLSKLSAEIMKFSGISGETGK